MGEAQEHRNTGTQKHRNTGAQKQRSTEAQEHGMSVLLRLFSKPLFTAVNDWFSPRCTASHTASQHRSIAASQHHSIAASHAVVGKKAVTYVR